MARTSGWVFGTLFSGQPMFGAGADPASLVFSSTAELRL